jgi:5-methylcytosine-specific restriction protein A
MSAKSDLLPTTKHRLMDLLEQAGIDVSDWANSKGGANRAAGNPKYCYEWVFIKPKEFVVLNLWHDLFEERPNGEIFMRLNPRKYAGEVSGIESVRAYRGDDALQLAVRDKLPIRVIVITGRRRAERTEKASRVEARCLDPIRWRVTEYDWKSGDCILTRGAEMFIDQFSILNDTGGKPQRREVSGYAFDRCPVVRRNVLHRANGKCEWCGELGFTMPDGRIYVETHHVISLGENGLDTESNVAALCPNHHREAHHGGKRTEMRKSLQKKLAALYGK